MTAEQTVLPGYRGEIFEVEALPEGDVNLPPGTDLAAMAEKALGYLARNPDPRHNHDARFTFLPHRCPPFAPEVTASLFAGEGQASWYERSSHIDPVAVGDTESRNDIACNLMREMARSETGREVQEIVHRRLVGYVRSGSGQPGDDLCWTVPYSLFAAVDDEPYAMVWTTAMLLQSETDLFRLSGEAAHRRLARRLFEGLRRVAHWDTGRAFYPDGVAPFREGVAVSGAYPGHYPNVISPLVHYWRSCGDPEALAFAEAMAEGFLSDLQPGRLHKVDGHIHGHSHLQMHAIRGVAQLGALTGNWRYLDWIQRAYDFSHETNFDTGWAPEMHWHTDHRTHSETCLVADMLETAAWLANAGQPHLWDRVDRTIRNYLAPAQFFVTPDFEAFWRQVNARRSPRDLADGLAGLRELEGGFLGGMTPNDRVTETRDGKPHHGMVPFEGRHVMVEMPGCCPPSAMRAIHIAWANTVVRTPLGVLVNLAFDRDAPEAEVVSYMPQYGRLSATARVAADFWLRPPAWAPRRQVKAWRNGREVEARWGGPAFAYLSFAGVESGETLELTWPLVRFRQRMTQRYMDNSEEDYGRFVNGDTYTFHWTGSTVTAVEPAGSWLPWYPPGS